MTAPVRVGAIHALAHSAAPTQAAFDRVWPNAQVAHLSDGSLYLDRSQGTADTPEITRRIGRLVAHSEACGAAGILFTGSFFGDSVREVRTSSGVPVLTSFEGIVRRAIGLQRPLCVLSTAADSTVYLASEIAAEARQTEHSVELESRVVANAMNALNANDAATHDRLVLEAIETAGRTHAVVLAQFTMERVIEEATKVTSAPVIGPATEGVALLRATVEGTD